jgi:peptide/nickel transport system permease protein
VIETPNVVPDASMVAPDIELAELDVGAPTRRPSTGLLLGAGELVLGTALIIVGTLVMTDLTAWPRVVAVLLGLYAIYKGVDSIGKRVGRPAFDTSYWVALSWVALIVGLAAVADLLPLKPYDDVQAALSEPSLARPDLLSAHPLGTDNNGLDILGGVIYGARVSLAVGAGAVLIGMIVGSAIGVSAGFFRGRLDGAASLLTDAMLAFPPLILLLALVAVLDPSVVNIMLALALLGIPTYIRLSRANSMVFSQREFVLAARALGATNRRIIVREVLPNVALPIISFAFLVVGALMVAEASLSFLGLGIQRPTPTWGNMIANGEAGFVRNPHVVFAPGICLFLTVFAFNRIGEKARNRWDPRRSRL